MSLKEFINQFDDELRENHIDDIRMEVTQNYKTIGQFPIPENIKHEWTNAYADPKQFNDKPDIKQYIKDHPERINDETGLFNFGPMERLYFTVKIEDE